MIIDNIQLQSLVPFCILVEVDQKQGKVEIIQSADGEAFMRVGNQPVERYTALVEHELLSNETVDDNDKLYKLMSDFWEAFYDPNGIVIPVEQPDSPLGYTQLPIQLFGVMSKVADYPGNLRIKGVNVFHTYVSRAVQPSMRQDIAVSYVASEQPAKADYYFSDLMAYFNDMSEKYDCQFMIGLNHGSLTLTPKYNGYNDKRHMRMNDELDIVLGVRHVKDKAKA